MKRKSYKIRNLERHRKSVFYDDLNTCCYCGSTFELTKHEIFEGRNRIHSMEYGFVLPLCWKCHQKLQEDVEFNKKWKSKAQTYFINYIGTYDDFMNIFRKNYM